MKQDCLGHWRRLDTNIRRNYIFGGAAGGTNEGGYYNRKKSYQSKISTIVVKKHRVARTMVEGINYTR